LPEEAKRRFQRIEAIFAGPVPSRESPKRRRPELVVGK